MEPSRPGIFSRTGLQFFLQVMDAFNVFYNFQTIFQTATCEKPSYLGTYSQSYPAKPVVDWNAIDGLCCGLVES
jgi:hypothetical protein